MSNEREKARILIVEDNLEIREAIAEAVALFGYPAPLSAGDGRQGLELLAGAPDPELPALIILDLMMPVMSGWEFRENQLRDPRIAGIPVALISADRNVQDEAEWLGASGCLSKPLELEDLRLLIARFCDSQKPKESEEEPEDESGPPLHQETQQSPN